MQGTAARQQADPTRFLTRLGVTALVFGAISFAISGIAIDRHQLGQLPHVWPVPERFKCATAFAIARYPPPQTHFSFINRIPRATRLQSYPPAVLYRSPHGCDPSVV